MKQTKKYFANILILFFLFSPFLLQAADSTLVFCNTGQPNPDGTYPNPCGWPQLIELSQKIINFAILLILPIAAVVLSYAGFLIMSSGGDEGKVKKAKEMFTKVAIGIAWILAAWLVVNTILNALLAPGYSLLK